MRRAIGLLAVAAAATLLAGCTVPVYAPNPGDTAGPGAQPAPSRAAPGPTGSAGAVSWQPCPEVPAQILGRGSPTMRYDCATVPVPKDWANPGGETFGVALLRARSTSQGDRIGSLLVNPGGPGGSGIDTAAYLSLPASFGGLPEEVTDRFDIVGFDPRGVGRSDPIECVAGADLDAIFGADPDPVEQAEFDQSVAINRKPGESCRQKYGDELGLFSTLQAAKDMDAIRQAVGDEKLTYLGYSYGTLLGSVYAQLFPDKIRALVLDGAVDPELDPIASTEGQAKGFELAFGNFVRWCDATPQSCPIAPNSREAVLTATEKARVSPVTGANGRVATSGWVHTAVFSSLYDRAAWELLAEAIADLEQGDPTGVFQRADSYAMRDPSGRYTNFWDAFYTINCGDYTTQPDPQRIRALQEQWRTAYPVFGAGMATSMLVCSSWPAKPDPYPTGAATGAPPIVVVGTTGDPATPYAQAGVLAKQLGVGRLLTWEGEGHTAYPKTTCVADAVNAYLIDLKVPAESLRCPAR
jgi:pimeloyl-ACP methyl ester carboxylesterase